MSDKFSEDKVAKTEKKEAAETTKEKCSKDTASTSKQAKSKRLGFEIQPHIDKAKAVLKISIAWLKILKAKVVPFAANQWSKAKPLISQYKKQLIIAGAILVVLIIIAVIGTMLSRSHSTQDSKNYTGSYPVSGYSASTTGQTGSNILSEQLTDISAKLGSVEQKISGGHAYVNLDQVRMKLSDLHAEVTSLAAQSNQLITRQIRASTDQLQSELVTIKKELALMSNKKLHHHQLSASSLPFKVVSIDNIQQSEVVTINYVHRIVPLEIGDALAGWTLISASNVDQKAQFRNQNDNYVSLNLNQISVFDRGAV